MSRIPCDITGLKSGKLVAVKRMYYKKNQGYLWLCKCECGGETVANIASLKKGRVKSCGCHRKHGMTGTRLYSIWKSMIRRCYNPNAKGYKDYGQRGISVHPDWLRFKGFLKDMGNSYRPELSIDRIDNNKGYSKENCRWATGYEQANNRRNNHQVAYKGETMNMQQWAVRYGLKRQTLYRRLVKGWNIEDALTVPASNTNRYCNV